MLANAARRFASVLFGGRCYLCRGASARGALLCAPCLGDLPRLPTPGCPRCALPSPEGALCGRCLARPPQFDATVAALVYAFPADVLVHALKYRGELALAPLLGGLLATALPPDARVDVALPVPLSAQRLRGRGYNQAMEIARSLCAPMAHSSWRATWGRGRPISSPVPTFSCTSSMGPAATGPPPILPPRPLGLVAAPV